jgi:hypothetical protein
MDADYEITLPGTPHRAVCQVPWDGVTAFPAGSAACPVAFDTETELIDRSTPAHVPRLAVATACYGGVAVLLWPEQLPAWLRLHAGCHLVMHNAAFDWWVVSDELHAQQDDDAHALWLRYPGDGRLHDTQTLDQLVRLAGSPYPFQAGRKLLEYRGLGELSRVYLKTILDKDDPYRKRYGELLTDRSLLTAEPGFWRYALADALATHLLWPRLHAAARRQLDRYNRHCPPSRRASRQQAERYGVLTESLQTRAAVALFAATRRGLRVCPEEAARIAARLNEDIDAQVALMRQHSPDVFRYAGGRREDQPGQGFLPGVAVDVLRTEKTGRPSLNDDGLRRTLLAVAAEIGEPPVYSGGGDDDEAADETDGGDNAAAADSGRTVSVSSHAWAHLKGRHPFLKAWVELKHKSQLLSYQSVFGGQEVVHAPYNPLLVTGRVSATGGLQQCPKEDWFRRQFVARPGHLLYTVDYCLRPDTLVKTIDGDRPIREIKPGDKVFSLRGRKIAWSEVTRIAEVGLLPSYRVTFDNGESVIASSDHRWPARVLVKSTRFGQGQSWKLETKTTAELEVGMRMVPCRTQVHPQGYRHLYAFSAFEYTKEHVLVAEAAHGPRPEGAHVHHINGIKTDNRPINLMYMDGREHASMESRAFWAQAPQELRDACAQRLRESVKRRRSYKGKGNPNYGTRRGTTRSCLRCDKEFYVYPSQPKVYCSQACYRDASENGLNHTVTKIEFVGLQPMHAITVEPDGNYVLSCGVVTMNCFIELRTFSAVCLKWFGQSRLAEVIKEGLDPHAYTAAMLQGIGYEDFQRLKQTDPDRHKRDRQASKACSFGLIGGLGAKRLAIYCESQYGVVMTEQQAKQARDKIINDVYPEMKLYLQEPLTALNHNLDATDRELSGLLFAGKSKHAALRALKNMLAGGTFKDTPLHKALLAFTARMPPAMAAMVRRGRGHPDVERWLFGEAYATLTGRVAGGRIYTAARNGPFQALAADGAKLALWRLFEAGLSVVAFIHDEVIVELPEGTAEEMTGQVDACLVGGMEEALAGLVPAAVEGKLAPHWAKG